LVVRACVRIDDLAFAPTLRGCSFISTETSTAVGDRPISPVLIDVGPTDAVTIDSCIFDGGISGFNNGAGRGFGLDAENALLNSMAFENITLLRGAGISVGTNSTGYIHVGTSTGSADVEWDD